MPDMLSKLHCAVQVESEEDVCNAIQHWVLADPVERKPIFGDLFGEHLLIFPHTCHLTATSLSVTLACSVCMHALFCVSSE